MVGNTNSMTSYTVYKTATAQPLPPNYHLRRTRNEDTSRYSEEDQKVDSYVPRTASVAYKNREDEEENLFNLFKRLNEKVFGKKGLEAEDEQGSNSYARPTLVRPAAPRTEEKQLSLYYQESDKKVPAQVANNWWNVLGSQEKVKKANTTNMVQDLQTWCQTEYDQTKEQDEAFYTPAELRERISTFKEIGSELTISDLKSKWGMTKQSQNEESEPWDLALPLPINAKAIGSYVDQDESYRNTYYSSTMELVA
jgi:hypothetical protein